MTLLNRKVELKLKGHSGAFCLQLVMIMIVMVIIFLLSKTQNYMFCLSL